MFQSMREENKVFQRHYHTTHSLVNDYLHDEVHNGTPINTDSAPVIKVMVNGVAVDDEGTDTGGGAD